MEFSNVNDNSFLVIYSCIYRPLRFVKFGKVCWCHFAPFAISKFLTYLINLLIVEPQVKIVVQMECFCYISFSRFIYFQITLYFNDYVTQKRIVDDIRSCDMSTCFVFRNDIAVVVWFMNITILEVIFLKRKLWLTSAIIVSWYYAFGAFQRSKARLNNA